MYIIKGIYFPRKFFTERGNIMLNERIKKEVENISVLLGFAFSYDGKYLGKSRDFYDGVSRGYAKLLSVILDKKVTFEFKYADDKDEWVQTEVKLVAEGTVIFKYQEINHPEWGYYEKFLWDEDGIVEEYDTCPSWKKEYI